MTPFIHLDIQKLSMLIFNLIAFFICVGYKGYGYSWKLRNSELSSAMISTINGETLKTNIIRSLNKGVIVGVKNEPIEYIPWSIISNIKNIEINKEFKGLLCYWFNINCKK